MAPIQPPGLSDTRSPATGFTHICSLCNFHRLIGSLLAFRPGTGTGMVWVW